MKVKEREFDEMTDVAQTLLQMCADSRVNICISQITSRYTALQMTSKVCIISTCLSDISEESH